MQKVCIIGAEGLLGSEIFFRLQKINKFELFPIKRSNINQYENFECDLLINANGSSRKGWCNENPKECCIFPCMHIVTCSKCSDELKNSTGPGTAQCPACNQKFNDIQRVFIE